MSAFNGQKKVDQMLFAQIRRHGITLGEVVSAGQNQSTSRVGQLLHDRLEGVDAGTLGSIIGSKPEVMSVINGSTTSIDLLSTMALATMWLRLAELAPRYEHHCKECMPLGRYESLALSGIDAADLYYHRGSEPRLVVRFGNGEWDYVRSGVIDRNFNTHDPFFRTALMRAVHYNHLFMPTPAPQPVGIVAAIVFS
jgi:hypothetical protein